MKSVVEEIKKQIHDSDSLRSLFYTINDTGNYLGQSDLQKAARMINWLSKTSQGNDITLIDLELVFNELNLRGR